MTNKTTKFAHFASITCVLHCFLTPLIVIMAPFLGHYFENLWVEIGLLIISILCGLYVVYSGYCRHKKKHGVFLFAIGATLWALHSLFELNEIVGAKIYFLIGTILVLIAYYINHRLLSCCPSDCCSD